MFKFFGFVLRGAYRFLKAACVLVFGVIAVGILLAIVNASMQQSKDALFIADETALEITIEGFVVEEAQPVSPLAFAGIGGEMTVETVLLDVTLALYKASEDDRISAIILRLDRMFGASPAALAEIGLALQANKDAGKQIYAYGDFYIQPQYYLASYADEILLNPAGVVSLTGYGIYPLYFKEALDKYNVTVNTFKAGTFKSFVEPYTRSSMSDEAREANALFLGDLWDRYRSDVETNLPGGAQIAPYVNAPVEGLRAASGNSAQWALNSGLVTQLATRDDMRRKYADLFGASADGYEALDYRAYLRDAAPSIGGGDVVAILYAVGNIMDGEQPAGTVGGDTLAKRIRQAANNDRVKAIVLRIDSPGGSAFASEIIRQELIAAKDKGKTIVASFGGAAASGGYWIATAADKIMAHPTSITGSIGVFIVAPSVENALSTVGIASDGVATTPLAGAFSVSRGISDLGKEMLQLQVDQTYQQFLSIVAASRSMTVEAVDGVAQGRVWTGAQALERGLVDEFGTLDDAIEAAATLAGLEDFEKIIFTDPPSPLEQVLRQLTPYMGAQLPQNTQAYLPQFTMSPASLITRAQDAVKPLAQGGIYARCLECLALGPISGH